MDKIQKAKNSKFCQECRIIWTLIHCGWERKIIQPLWKMTWQFLTKLNIVLPYNLPILPPPRYLCKWFENSSPDKNLYTDVYSSLIHSSPKLEVMKMSFNRLVDEQSGVHPLNERLLKNKQEWTILNQANK